MQVRWSMPAAEDLERICERIERDNPEAARRAAKTIYDGGTRLKDFPRLGRASKRMRGRRELVLGPCPTSWSIGSRNTPLKFRASSTVRRTGRGRPSPAFGESARRVQEEERLSPQGVGTGDV
jgi:plasmid stabilization system protein ParE